MSHKFITALVTVVVLASTGVAFAQDRAQRDSLNACDPYAGTIWDGVAPYNANSQCDPYKGTIWEDVAPY